MNEAWMRAALTLGRRGAGQTWPNPAVGCVIVRDGLNRGMGWTGRGGRPHAESVALDAAREAARGATAYVTLEPCAHVGQTPACAGLLVEAGIARVVAALADPDPRVAGRGFARLREAGIAVETGLLEAEARRDLAGYLLHRGQGRPLVTLKLAATLDGRIATRHGESRWITGDAARRAAHALRGLHDGVMVGIGTALADDPALTCRLDGFAPRPPVRIVADGSARLPPHSQLVQTAAEAPVILLHGPAADPAHVAALRDRGVTCLGLDAMTPAAMLAALAGQGLTAILLEGGAALAASFVKADLVDRIVWFAAPALLGGDARAALDDFGLERLAEAPRFRQVRNERLGEDTLIELERACSPA